jgi:hypothetical protein
MYQIINRFNRPGSSSFIEEPQVNTYMYAKALLVLKNEGLSDQDLEVVTKDNVHRLMSDWGYEIEYDERTDEDEWVKV